MAASAFSRIWLSIRRTFGLLNASGEATSLAVPPSGSCEPSPLPVGSMSFASSSIGWFISVDSTSVLRAKAIFASAAWASPEMRSWLAAMSASFGPIWRFIGIAIFRIELALPRRPPC